MSIVPVSHLSGPDLMLLGNNVRPERSRPRKRTCRVLGAVNRSLSAFGEAVADLHRRPHPSTVALPRRRRA